MGENARLDAPATPGQTATRDQTAPEEGGIDRSLAARLADLRRARGWSLDQLAERSGVSRSTLSRLEAGSVSPTATLLGRLSAVYGMRMSRLIALAESAVEPLVPRAEQRVWADPETGFRRRAVSPPVAGMSGDVIEGLLPAGATIDYPAPAQAGFEHHLVLLSGALRVTLGGREYPLSTGDALRYRPLEAMRFHAPGPEPARYHLFTT